MTAKFLVVLIIVILGILIHFYNRISKSKTKTGSTTTGSTTTNNIPEVPTYDEPNGSPTRPEPYISEASQDLSEPERP
jgi:hypothetical protein